MTANDVVEAMGNAIADALDWTPAMCPRARLTDAARAALRAVTARGGLVVGRMPGDSLEDAVTLAGQAYEIGYKDALAAVRAAAVEVE